MTSSGPAGTLLFVVTEDWYVSLLPGGAYRTVLASRGARYTTLE